MPVPADPPPGALPRPRPYLMACDLRRLSGVLDESAAELAAAGVIHPGDEGYARARLALAAVILGQARAGEGDPARLRRAAVRAFDPGALAARPAAL